MAKKENPSQFTCEQCSKSFATKNALKQHKKATNHSNPINGIKAVCPYCNHKFPSQITRDQHIIKVHKPEKCHYCNKKFKTKSALEQHVQSVHPTEVIVCPHCNKGFKTQNGLNQHISTVHQINCPHCNQVFISQALLSQHIQETHQNKLRETFICHSCKKVFKTANALQQHKKSKIHQIEQPNELKCPECNKKFKDKNALNQHMVKVGHKKEKTDITLKKFLCPHCNKGFISKNALNQHLESKHQKKIKGKSVKKKGIALFEKRTFKEKLVSFFGNIFHNKRIIIMDECVGNDSSIIDALNENFIVNPLPKELLGHSDQELRLALAEKKWGLVSKDYEMVVVAREMNIKPVYLLTEKRNHRDLIRISKRNYKVS